jgi:hypothetical protein
MKLNILKGACFEQLFRVRTGIFPIARKYMQELNETRFLDKVKHKKLDE